MTKQQLLKIYTQANFDAVTNKARIDIEINALFE